MNQANTSGERLHGQRRHKLSYCVTMAGRQRKRVGGLKHEHCIKHAKHGAGRIMLWGCFAPSVLHVGADIPATNGLCPNCYLTLHK